MTPTVPPAVQRRCALPAVITRALTTITHTSANRRLLLIRAGRVSFNEERAETLSEARRDPRASQLLRLKTDQINAAFYRTDALQNH